MSIDLVQMLARRLLVGRRRRPRKIPRQKEPRRAKMRYLRMLRRLVRDRDQLVRDTLHPEIERLVDMAQIEARGGRRDSWMDDILKVFDSLRVSLGETWSDRAVQGELFEIARDISTHTGQEHRKQISAAMGAPTGFALPMIIPSAGVDAKIADFIQENTRLVKTLVGQDFDRMQTIVTQGVTNGLRVQDVWKELLAKLPVTQAHARLLAVDQTLKLAGQLTRVRQEDAGIDEYTWDTSQDERVRPRHRELHGTRQRWDSPPEVDPRSGRRAHPGGDYRCRCQAIPVLPTELLAE